jgi:hypothetical protein
MVVGIANPAGYFKQGRPGRASLGVRGSNTSEIRMHPPASEAGRRRSRSLSGLQRRSRAGDAIRPGLAQHAGVPLQPMRWRLRKPGSDGSSDSRLLYRSAMTSNVWLLAGRAGARPLEVIPDGHRCERPPSNSLLIQQDCSSECAMYAVGDVPSGPGAFPAFDLIHDSETNRVGAQN